MIYMLSMLRSFKFVIFYRFILQLTFCYNSLLPLSALMPKHFIPVYIY